MNRPTQSELALLAATLARTGTESPATLASTAYDIWLAAGGEIASRDRPAKDAAARDAAQVADVPDVPTPKKFPVSLDRFLSLLLPKKVGRSGDKFALYRQWLSASMRLHRYMTGGGQGTFEDTPPPTKSEVDHAIAKHRKKPYTEENYYPAAQDFVRWYKHTQTAEIAKARSAAGRRGGRKKKKC